MMILYFIILYVIHFFLLCGAFDFACPPQAHWSLRGKSKCVTLRNYSCLFDVNLQVNVYREKCIRPRILGPGYKYVFQPNPNRDSCGISRFQPFIFHTTGYSDCVYLKSMCDSEGQKVHTNGTTVSDRLCSCSIDKGFSFVHLPLNGLYCNIITEDCSCYLGTNQINGTTGWKDLIPDENRIDSTNLHGNTLDKLDSKKNNDFDNFKYNIHAACLSNKYRSNARICVLIMMSSYILVTMGIRFFIQYRSRQKQINNIPRDFSIVDFTHCSITVQWYHSDSCLRYELLHRIQNTSTDNVVELTSLDIRVTENGQGMYKLQNLTPDTCYLLTMCSIHKNVKSRYTGNKLQKTQNIVLPVAINILEDEDKIQYNELMQSSKTEERYFVRVMIVGKHSAGKTCLLRRLLKESIADVSSTDGVDIVVSRCKIDIDTGKWTIDKGIVDDKVTRIKEALIPNELNTTHAYNTDKIDINVENDKTEDDTYVSKENTSTNDSEENIVTNILILPETKPSVSDNILPSFEHRKSIDENNSASVPDLEILTPEVENIPADSNKEANASGRASSYIQPTDTEAKVDLEDNEHTNESLSLVMPDDLMSNVFSKPAGNISSNRYALCELWDFAGQREFYATHQAFLTSNAVYLVVADMTDDISKQDINQCFADYKNVGEYVDFWFDSIHCHWTTNLLIKDYLNPPVLLVFTGTDKYKKDKLLEDRKQILDEQLDMVLGRQTKHHHLHQKFYLSNTTDPDEEFEKVRKAIYEAAKQIDNWGKSFPLKWILLEHLIEINKENGRNYITLKEMFKMAKHQDINITKPEDMSLFLRFQHNVGNIIYFENIPNLIILNPQWLVDAFRCLVSNRSDSTLHHLDDWTQLKRHGKISEDLITKLFESKTGQQFTGQKVNLHKIMERLDILVKIEDSNMFIMPSLMPSFTFEEVCRNVGIKNCQRSSWLCLKFEFLPPSFFNHLSAWFIRKYNPSKVDRRKASLALYRGICMFDIDGPGTACEKIMVTMSTDTIALQMLSFSKQQKEFGITCSIVYNQVDQIIEEIKERYQLKLSYEPNFKCSTGRYYKDTMLYKDLKNKTEYYCTEHKTSHRSEDVYLPWMTNTNKTGQDDEVEMQSDKIVVVTKDRDEDDKTAKNGKVEPQSEKNVVVTKVRDDYGKTVKNIREETKPEKNVVVTKERDDHDRAVKVVKVETRADSNSAKPDCKQNDKTKKEKDDKVQSLVLQNVAIIYKQDDDEETVQDVNADTPKGIQDKQYNEFLAEVIYSVTELNPNMSVERIECMRQIEEVE